MPGNIQLRKVSSSGLGSFFLDPVIAAVPALSKVVGKATSAIGRGDRAVGNVLSKVPGIGRLFKEKVTQTVSQAGKPYEMLYHSTESRASAPFVKAQKFVTPLLAFEGARRLLPEKGKAKADVVKESGEHAMTREERQVLVKAASLIERLSKEREFLIGELARHQHEKNASKLAHEMAEKALITQDEVEKKAEELSKESDLGVVKKAMSFVKEGASIGRPENSVKVDGIDGELDPLTEYLVGYIRH